MSYHAVRSNLSFSFNLSTAVNSANNLLQPLTPQLTSVQSYSVSVSTIISQITHNSFQSLSKYTIDDLISLSIELLFILLE
ncbi:MAG: hypothetical protein U9Q66_01740 [Patescibacteria group bacterium]|nr:hypothetical protein [Patescibacteria group bacterium]